MFLLVLGSLLYPDSNIFSTGNTLPEWRQDEQNGCSRCLLGFSARNGRGASGLCTVEQSDFGHPLNSALGWKESMQKGTQREKGNLDKLRRERL